MSNINITKAKKDNNNKIGKDRNCIKYIEIVKNNNIVEKKFILFLDFIKCNFVNIKVKDNLIPNDTKKAMGITINTTKFIASLSVGIANPDIDIN